MRWWSASFCRAKAVGETRHFSSITFFSKHSADCLLAFVPYLWEKKNKAKWLARLLVDVLKPQILAFKENPREHLLTEKVAFRDAFFSCGGELLSGPTVLRKNAADDSLLL